MPPNFEFSPLAYRQPISRRILTKAVKKRHQKLGDSSFDVPISVLVRNYNEAEDLTKLLKSISGQIYKAPIQIVLQDNGSTDGSLKIAEKYDATIASMVQADFTYPKGLNIGMEKTKYEVVVITVAHSLPVHNYWLRTTAQHFADPKVAGIYGPIMINDGSKFLERTLRPIYLMLRKSKNITETGLGVLGATNCAIRRGLWQKQPFDEAYEAGAEDSIWAGGALKKGYKISRDRLFAVHHTHQTTLVQTISQVRLWKKMLNQPLPIHDRHPNTKHRFNREK